MYKTLPITDGVTTSATVSLTAPQQLIVKFSCNWDFCCCIMNTVTVENHNFFPTGNILNTVTVQNHIFPHREYRSLSARTASCGGMRLSAIINPQRWLNFCGILSGHFCRCLNVVCFRRDWRLRVSRGTVSPCSVSLCWPGSLKGRSLLVLCRYAGRDH